MRLSQKIKRIHNLSKFMRQFTGLLNIKSVEKSSNFPRHQQQPIKNVHFE